MNTGTIMKVSVMNRGSAQFVPPPIPRLAPSLCTTSTISRNLVMMVKRQPSASAKCFVKRSAASIIMQIPAKRALFQPKFAFILRPRDIKNCFIFCFASILFYSIPYRQKKLNRFKPKKSFGDFYF